MSFAIFGQGTALPPYSIGFEEAVALANKAFAWSPEQQRQLEILYRMTGVRRRHSVILDGPDGTPHRHSFLQPPNDGMQLGPSIRERMDRYERESGPLAREAARQALDNAGVGPKEITHLITVSCSGFAAPGVDVHLIKALSLEPTVERTHVGFMGCHGALNGLRVARGFVESDRRARVLLCAVELCSLHYHYGWDPERLVANALFADGAAALVGGWDDEPSNGRWRVRATGSCLVPDSEDAMRWRIGNNGFIMSLSAAVPELIAEHLRPWMDAWLSRNGLAIGNIRSWAVHPGGPRILGSVARALGLPRGATDVSKEILRDHGNMSSPTILFILDRLRRLNAPRPCVALGFGPGLVAEATLFD